VVRSKASSSWLCLFFSLWFFLSKGKQHFLNRQHTRLDLVLDGVQSKVPGELYGVCTKDWRQAGYLRCWSLAFPWLRLGMQGILQYLLPKKQSCPEKGE
jgi:hypothetical protein